MIRMFYKKWIVISISVVASIGHLSNVQGAALYQPAEELVFNDIEQGQDVGIAVAEVEPLHEGTHRAIIMDQEEFARQLAANKKYVNELFESSDGTSCPVCSNTGYKRASLQKHLEMVHCLYKLYNCSCGYKVNAKGRLDEHLVGRRRPPNSVMQNEFRDDIKVTPEEAAVIFADFQMGSPNLEKYVCQVCLTRLKSYSWLRRHCRETEHPIADVYLAAGTGKRNQVNDERTRKKARIQQTANVVSVDPSLPDQSVVLNQPEISPVPAFVDSRDSHQGVLSPQAAGSLFNQNNFELSGHELPAVLPPHDRLVMLTPEQIAQAVAAAQAAATRVQQSRSETQLNRLLANPAIDSHPARELYGEDAPEIEAVDLWAHEIEQVQDRGVATSNEFRGNGKVTREKAAIILANFKLGSPDLEKYVCQMCLTRFKSYDSLRPHCNRTGHPIADVYLVGRKRQRKQIGEKPTHKKARIQQTDNVVSPDPSLPDESAVLNQPEISPVPAFVDSGYNHQGVPPLQATRSLFNQNNFELGADELPAVLPPNNDRLVMLTPEQIAQAVAAAQAAATRVQQSRSETQLNMLLANPAIDSHPARELYGDDGPEIEAVDLWAHVFEE